MLMPICALRNSFVSRISSCAHNFRFFGCAAAPMLSSRAMAPVMYDFIS